MVSKTAVVFRIFNEGGAIALFPNIVHGALCSSYMHVGQHGDADYDHVVNISHPPKTGDELWEVDNLRRELRWLGYHLVEYDKRPKPEVD